MCPVSKTILRQSLEVYQRYLIGAIIVIRVILYETGSRSYFSKSGDNAQVRRNS